MVEEGKLRTDEGGAVPVHHFQKQLALIAEGVVERAAIEIHRVQQIFHRCGFIALVPEDLHGPLDRVVWIEFFLAGHWWLSLFLTR